MGVRPLTFIDLFAGCGGFSEGFYLEGYKALSHIEIDKHACETLKERMHYYQYSKDDVENSVMCEDLTDANVITKLKHLVKDEPIDLVIGGPPCQSFSTLGRAKDVNGMVNDSRNYLFENYMDIIENFRPKMFVFENVRGLLTQRVNGELISDMIFSRMRESYKIITDPKTIVLNSVHYGVPQIRERVIIIGIRNDIDKDPAKIYETIEKTHYAPGQTPEKNQQPFVNVGEAILDLPPLLPGEGQEEYDIHSPELNRYLKEIRKPEFKKHYNHTARTHNELDMERYRLMSKNNWTLTELYENVPNLVHEKKRLFNNSYVVQREHLPARTIIAHLYKDGNQFIHPDHTQKRTLTVREAARLQSFPDDFKFMGSRTQQYKQVGNAVPPLMARAIAKALKKFL